MRINRQSKYVNAFFTPTFWLSKTQKMQKRLVSNGLRNKLPVAFSRNKSTTIIAEQKEHDNSKFTNTAMYRKPFRTKQKDAILNPLKETKKNYKPTHYTLPQDHPSNTVGKIASGKFQISTPETTEQETMEKLTQQITKIRGGYDKDDGTGSVNDASWGEYFEWLERSDPQVSELYRHKRNLNNANWLFDQAPPNAKPMQYFEQRLQEYGFLYLLHDSFFIVGEVVN